MAIKTTIKLGTEKEIVKRYVPVIKDGDLDYVIESRQGPAIWRDLRKADYGKLDGRSLKQITMPQAVRLAYAGLENNIKEVVEAVNEYWLIGNTLIGWDLEGMCGIDMPSDKLVSQLEVDNPKVLSKILGKYKAQLGREEGGVIFSDDGRVRFTPLDKIIFGEQTARTLARNPGNIVLSGSLENAELNARSARRYILNPRFYGFNDAKFPKVGVPGLVCGGFGGGLCVVAGYFCVDECRFSFGVLDSGEASAK